jgi:hypothetical protein
MREIEPELVFQWDVRDAVTVRPPGSSRFWCRIKTKEADALEFWLISRRGQINQAYFEGIGRDVEIEDNRTDKITVTKIRFVTFEHLGLPKLKSVLKEHLQSFQAAVANVDTTKEAS